MKISKEIRVWSKPLQARQDVRVALRQRFPSVPDEYVEVAESWADLEFEYAGDYFRIWGGLRAIEFDEGYRVGELLPGGIPVGDDGGGQFFVYFVGGSGWGVYRGAFGNIGPGEVRWVASSLTDMLENPGVADWRNLLEY